MPQLSAYRDRPVRQGFRLQLAHPEADLRQRLGRILPNVSLKVALVRRFLSIFSLLDGEFQRPRNGKKNDKAHPPIHPTAHAGNLDADERRVFELVTRRFLASCHKNAEGKTTSVEIDINGESFSTSGAYNSQIVYTRLDSSLQALS